MLKKLIGLTLATLILMGTVVAYAAIPSKTTNDLIKIVKIVDTEDDLLNGLITVSATPSETAIEQLDAVRAFVDKGSAVIDYFPDDVKTQISTLFPTTVDQKKLVMSEFVDLTLGEYQPSYGDLTTLIEFPTLYRANQVVVAMVGYTDESGNVVWQALETTVIDGRVQVVIPSDLLQKLGKDFILSVLSE